MMSTIRKTKYFREESGKTERSDSTQFLPSCKETVRRVGLLRCRRDKLSTVQVTDELVFLFRFYYGTVIDPSPEFSGR